MGGRAIEWEGRLSQRAMVFDRWGFVCCQTLKPLQILIGKANLVTKLEVDQKPKNTLICKSENNVFEPKR